VGRLDKYKTKFYMNHSKY